VAPAVESAGWVSDWIDELIAFPNAAHDDVVDVVAYAARVAAAHWLPAEAPARPSAGGAAPAEQVYAAATGGRDGIDLMTAQW
jgi:hypothetical protein